MIADGLRTETMTYEFDPGKCTIRSSAQGHRYDNGESETPRRLTEIDGYLPSRALPATSHTQPSTHLPSVKQINMAFVSATGSSVLARQSGFRGTQQCARRSSATAGGIRMAGLTDKERKSFGKVGAGSQWRENVFVGGFPGGEEGFRDWVDKGMKDDVPDVPEFLQPKTEFKNSVDSRAKPGVLSLVEKVNFFPNILGTKESEDEEEAPAEGEAEGEPAMPKKDVDDAPPEELYAKYFPADKRNLAPKIIIQYDKSKPRDDKVGVAMFEVTAAASDLYFPADYSGMAPFIDIQYNGNLATAKVGVSMQKVENLPTIAPPVAKGETVTKLVPGNSGGLKLEFEVEGEGAVNVYSDPRCVENFTQKFPTPQ